MRILLFSTIIFLSACHSGQRQEAAEKARHVQDSLRKAFDEVNAELETQKQELLRQRDSLAKALDKMGNDIKKAGGKISRETDSALKALRDELKKKQ